MKTSTKFMASAVAASALSFGALAPAQADISASVSIASSYLWRGIDLSSGTPAVSGDLSYSLGAFYTGLWASSGDTNGNNNNGNQNGTEYDIYAGVGQSFGDFSYDLSVWNYVYPNQSTSEDSFGALTETILTLNYGPMSFTWIENIANQAVNGSFLTSNGYDGYRYFSLSATFGQFSVLLGAHDDLEPTDPKANASTYGNATHVDVSYAYNDNLSFTFSQFVDDENFEQYQLDDDLKFVVSYALPLN